MESTTKPALTRCRSCKFPTYETHDYRGYEVCRECYDALIEDAEHHGKWDGEPFWAIVWGFAIWCLIIGVIVWIAK